MVFFCVTANSGELDATKYLESDELSPPLPQACITLGGENPYILSDSENNSASSFQGVDVMYSVISKELLSPGGGEGMHSKEATLYEIPVSQK